MPILALRPFGHEMDRINLKQINSSLAEEGLVIIRGQENMGKNELLILAQLLSEKPGGIKEKVLHWDFGPVMELKYSPNAENYLFSDEAVPFHWDGAFYHEPSHLIFHCQESHGSGGETLFCHTGKMAEFLPINDWEEVEFEFKTDKKAHYGGTFSKKLVHWDSNGQAYLRFAESVKTELNPVDLTIKAPGLNSQALYQQLKESAYSPQFTYTHRWEKGDLVIADNTKLIHARRAIAGNRARRFYRVQVL
jgi:alpha-ketoglutarate-dependent taurine dioxygenase